MRAGELERWRTGGDYDPILAGNYTRRGDDGQGLSDDYADAADYYSDKANEAMSVRRRRLQPRPRRLRRRVHGGRRRSPSAVSPQLISSGR